MIRCKNTDCMHRYCCVDCERRESGECGCHVGENLNYDEKRILEKCEEVEKGD